MVLYAIVRIRGTVDVPPDVETTLRLLRLTRKYSAVIYPKNETIDGMLQVVKDWVTWGEVDREVLKELLLKRGRLPGNRRLSEEGVKNVLGITLDELLDNLMEGKLLWHKLDGKVKPVFRLHPPKGGFKRSTKKPYKAGGELGYRGSEINALLKKMI
ncbi:MAG: 50S ribosomal protein L30 [Desulfurococcales archaeon]|nr:50S ribosomal protein L30 [Desulfurococcales archaeon]